MVKLLALNGKIILTVIVAYYCEFNSAADKLEFWEPDPKFNMRRAILPPRNKPVAHVNQSKTEQPQYQNKKGQLGQHYIQHPKPAEQQHYIKNKKGPEQPQFRNNKGKRTGAVPDKYTESFHTEIRHSPPKQIARNGQPHIEFLQLQHKNKSKLESNYNKGTDDSNEKDHNNDKEDTSDNDNKSDSDHYKNKGRSDSSDSNKNDKMNKNHKNKHNLDRSKNHNKDKHTNTHSNSEDEDHNNDSDDSKDNKIRKNKNHHKKNKIHVIDKKYNRAENKSRNRNGNMNQKMKANHNLDNNQNKNRNDNDDMDGHHNLRISHNMEKNYDIDNNHDMDIKHNNKNNMNKNQNLGTNENINNQNNVKNRNLENLHIKMPKISPEDNKKKVSSKWPIGHRHRSKLRTQRVRGSTDDVLMRSTRLTPMYLMQQPPEDAETTTTTKPIQEPEKIKQSTEAPTAPHTLTPYALMAQMKQIMSEFPGANATFDVIGRTVEYNDIVLIKVTEIKSDAGKYFRAKESKYIDDVPEKKIIFIVHGLSVMGMNNLQHLNSESSLKLLLSYYFKHLDKFDIFLIPMANPDGYSAKFSINIWNKNVSPQDACPGVMLDRNFDVAWNATRQISSCSMLYPGPTPFSETETKAVRDVFHYHGHKIISYIHVHAGMYTDSVFKGEAILYPRGYTDSQTDDDKYIDLKGEIEEAMKNASFQVMSVTVDTLHNWYGQVTGTSVDYASTVYGIPYALEFVMQLYDAGSREQTNDYYALTEIWSRIIDTTFNNMWKSLTHTNEVKRK